MEYKEKYPVISIFDTSIAAYNIGNEIIMEAVLYELREIYPNAFFIKLPVEDICKNALKYSTESSINFVGGTNILNSDIRKYRQWDLRFRNILELKNVILMGCGWWQYEDNCIHPYTKWALKRILSSKHIHSVRDSYTAHKLSSIGIKALNTGCPTLWNISLETTEKIPHNKSDKVVFTLTDYNKKPDRDIVLIHHIKQMYNNVFFFPQGTGDIDYLKQICANDIHIINPNLSEFDKILENNSIDYIGTRLHAGIRALQKGIRSYIIAIDNRSKEMAHDFGLPILEPENLYELDKIIESPYHIKLNIPYDNIKKWKSQFYKK